jgi:TonB family protein
MVGTQSIAKEMFYRNEAVSIAIQIASPCRVSWDSMEGDDITRFCGLCHLNVYNLSAINSKAAEEFLQSRVSSERVCVRFFRRHDGTIITEDCPVGLRKIRRLTRAVRTVAVSLISMLVSILPARAQSTANNQSLLAPLPVRFPMHPQPPDFVKPVVSSHPTPVEKTSAVMGQLPATNFRPFMENIQKKLLDRWQNCNVENRKLPVVEFKVHKDGSVSHIHITRSSGHPETDLTAIKVIEEEAPFHALPATADPDVDIQFTFNLDFKK